VIYKYQYFNPDISPTEEPTPITWNAAEIEKWWETLLKATVTQLGGRAEMDVALLEELAHPHACYLRMWINKNDQIVLEVVEENE
jgi:hypothetical protein